MNILEYKSPISATNYLLKSFFRVYIAKNPETKQNLVEFHSFVTVMVSQNYPKACVNITPIMIKIQPI